MTSTTKRPAITKVQRSAMTEAAGTPLGRLPHGLTGRTLDSLLSKGFAYVGDTAGRLYRTAVARGYTGFPQYFLTRAAYRALGIELTYVVCGECQRGKYAAASDLTFYRCTSPDCDHEITRADLVMDEPGEYVELRHWRLVVLHREPEQTEEPSALAA